MSLNGTCRSIRSELQDPGFWRTRFHSTFDKPTPGRASCRGYLIVDWRQKYQLRKYLLSSDADFTYCANQKTKAIINILKELIVEALPFVDASGKKTCKNFVLIEEYINESSLLKDMLRESFYGHEHERRPVETVLVALAAHFFDLNLFTNSPMYGFEYSQMAAYQSVVDSPIIHGNGNLMVNMSW